MTASARAAKSVMARRYKAAATMAKRLARLRLGFKQRVSTILIKVLPHDEYGIEHATPTEAAIRSLTRAILDVVATKGARNE